MKLEKLLGKGNTAEVYAWGETLALKLFYAEYRQQCLLEYEKAQTLRDLEGPVIRCHGLLEHEGRMGILYDRISGPSMLQELFEGKEPEMHMKQFADIHKCLLKAEVPDLPDYKKILAHDINRTERLTEATKQRILGLLDTLPAGEVFCHGDYHPGNLLVMNGQSYVIDFMSAAKGHPYFDIARTVFLLRYTPAVHAEQQAFKNDIADLYLKEMGVCEQELSIYLCVIAAARLWELRRDWQEIEAAEACLQKYMPS